jgi:hypothetical protein
MQVVLPCGTMSVVNIHMRDIHCRGRTLWRIILQMRIKLCQLRARDVLYLHSIVIQWRSSKSSMSLVRNMQLVEVMLAELQCHMVDWWHSSPSIAQQ